MIPYSRQSITDEDILAVSQTLKSDFLTQGPAVPAFEDALKNQFSVQHAIACSSGTAALHLAYASLGVDLNTIGIVPTITFAATANAFRYLGATVKFCDVDPQTGLLCLESLDAILKKISPKSCPCPVVISPVSLAGALAPLAEVSQRVNPLGFKVIEDASHSPGAFKTSNNRVDKSASCEHTDAACLSFHPVKHICSGEGGAILTNDNSIAKKAEKLRSHGIERPYDEGHETPWFYKQTALGWNYRMTDFQASLGKSQLGRLDEQLATRREIAQKYDQAFTSAPFNHYLDCPTPTSGHSWHLYVLRFKQKGWRDKAHKFLKEKGILTQIHYIPLYKHPYYQPLVEKVAFPGSEEYFDSCLSIPMFPGLTSEEQNTVIEEIGHFIALLG